MIRKKKKKKTSSKVAKSKRESEIIVTERKKKKVAVGNYEKSVGYVRAPNVAKRTVFAGVFVFSARRFCPRAEHEWRLSSKRVSEFGAKSVDGRRFEFSLIESIRRVVDRSVTIGRTGGSRDSVDII